MRDAHSVLPRRVAATLTLVLTASAITAVSAIVAPVVASAAPACQPVFIGVPGSGQNAQSGGETNRIGADLKNNLVPGGDIVIKTLDYPAVAWYKFAIPWTNLGKSEAIGVTNLTNLINQYRNGCSQRTILLAGYSQGVEVVTRTVAALPQSVRNNIAVSLLGDPSFTPNVQGDFDQNTAGQGIRPSFKIGRYILPTDVLPRTYDACAKGDPICSFRPLVWPQQVAALVDGRSAHFHYINLGLADQAASQLWSHRYRQTKPVITSPATLPNGTVGQPYSVTLTNADGRSGSWTVPRNSLPSGLVLSGAKIAGTPTAVQMNGFNTTFTDRYGLSASKLLTITVNLPASVPRVDASPDVVYPWNSGCGFTSPFPNSFTWTASNFAPDEALSRSLGPLAWIGDNPTTDATGSFSTTDSISDALMSGRYTFDAIGATNDEATTQVGVGFSDCFHHTTGTTVTFTQWAGAGWPATAVTLTLDGTTTVSATATTDQNGNFAGPALSVGCPSSGSIDYTFSDDNGDSTGGSEACTPGLAATAFSLVTGHASVVGYSARQFGTTG